MRVEILSQWRERRMVSFNDRTSKRVLDLLETGFITAERIILLKFGVNDRCSNDIGS